MDIVKSTVFSVFIAFIFCFEISAQTLTNGTTEKVRLQLKWKHQFQFAGYYAAVEKGFYEEVGLDVELIEASLNEAPAEAVFNGNAEFGTSTSDVILMRGEGKPIVLLAPIFQHSAQIIVANDSVVQNVHNLLGKRIMIEHYAADIITYLTDEGVPLTQCQVVPHSFNVNELITKEVDAITAYSTDEPFLLEKANVSYIELSPIAGGIDFYGDVLFTTQTLAQQNPEMVKRFLDASLKGWKYALQYPDELVDIIYNRYSKRHSKEHLRFEANKMVNLILPQVVKLGYSNEGRWEGIANVYKKRGLLSKDFSLKGLFFEDYLEKKTQIPWEIIFPLVLIVLILSSLSYFFYQLSKKLSNEVVERRKVEAELVLSKSELLELNRSKDKFFSIIAHDLKSPFNSVIGLITRIERNNHEMSEQERKLILQLFSKNLKNTYGLLENLLTWARNQLNKTDFNPEKLSVAEAINGEMELLSYQANDKQIGIRFKVNKEVFIFADKNMVSFIIRNLISNAIKFTNAMGCVQVFAEALNDDQVEIIVEDNGIGIRKERLVNIFELGESISTKGTNNEKGSGLGLILIKEFVEQNRGTIRVESQPEKGSRFFIVLPLMK